MSGNNKATSIPTPVAPLVDENGQITVPWRAWFSLLAQRVGGVTGFTLPTTLDGAGQIVAGVTWTSGPDAPPTITDSTKWPTSGSIYSQTDGDGTEAADTLFFVADGGGGWHPIATTDSPLFTGDPQAPTPPPGDNDTSIATTAFVIETVGAAVAAFLPGGGVTWTSGTGAPANAILPDPLPTRGSIYSQTDGTIARTLYVAQGDGTWLPVAGV